MAVNLGGNQESVDLKDFEESSLRKLRKRWELASVLNFFCVFEPLIGEEVKMSAEEVENALINPNASLTKLHIKLLKGIRPVNNKKLSDPGGWVTSLCKKLADWWPLVAEGEVPLTEAKGEEISRYKELDPTIRLLMLKALCEIRTMQHDLVSYINDSLKQGAQLSHFRKDKIGQDNGVAYWCDGNSVIGYRLYKEVNSSTLKQKHRGKNCLDLQNTKLEWEVLATNLDEFRKVSERLSSCQVGLEAAVQETIESEVIPVLEKIEKKKERDMKRRQKQEALLNDSHSYAAGITRSCRTRRPAKYTFDDFDRQIDEAIKLAKKRKGREVERNDTKSRKCGKRGDRASDGDSPGDAPSEEEPQASTSEDKQNDQQDGGSNTDEEDDQLVKSSEYNEEDEQQGEGGGIDEEDGHESESSDKDKATNSISNAGKSDSEISNSYSTDIESENVKSDKKNDVKLSRGPNESVASGLQMKKKSDCTSGQNLREARSPEAKNRYRQRPTRNSAIDSSVVPDSDDGSSSENSSVGASAEGEPYEVADSEDEI